MRPIETLAVAATPDGRRLTLHHRAGEFFLQLDGEEVMSSRSSASESALAELGCSGLANRRCPRLLIGGLGLGYTLRAAQRTLGREAILVVAEVIPEIISWNRELLGPVYRQTIEDRRVQLYRADVWTLLEAPDRYDAVLLDVDNGPSACCLGSNRRLYGPRGIARIRQALVTGGQLGVWSASSDPAFAKRLSASGFRVEAHLVRSHGRRGARHWVYLGYKARQPTAQPRTRRGR